MSADTRPECAVAWTVTWHAGPDAGGCQRLTVGQHLLGRGKALGADDPALAPHHAIVEVHTDGTLTITHLTGRHAERTRSMTDGGWLEVGDSLLHCTPDRSARCAPAHIRDGALVRPPRVVSTWTMPEPTPSSESPTASGLVPATLALVGAGVMALVMRQWMFMMFGLVGALVAVGTWAVQYVTSARGRRRSLRALSQSVDAYREHHLARANTLVRSVGTASAFDARLWERRAAHPDAFLVSPGIGPVVVPLAPDHGEPRVLDGVPIGIDLGPGARVALRGPQAMALARALVVQLTAACGPADLRIVFGNESPHSWSPFAGLPHRVDWVGAELAEHDHTHVLFVTDRPDTLALRTSPLRRALANPHRQALIVVLDAGDTIPHLCTHVADTTSGPTATWSSLRHSDDTTTFRVAALGWRQARACVAPLVGLRDPEDPIANDELPAEVSLSRLLGSSITAAWTHHAQHSDAGPSTPIGIAADGVVDLDLVRDGPHALIAGTTGSGKSELLRSMVMGMAAQASPQHLNFVLIDYKGGATFDDLAELPHVGGVVTDLDAHLADRVLRSLHAELRRRETVLREHRMADLPALRAAAPHVTMPRLVVMIDEFAALVHEQPDFLHALLGIAQRGRSLGVHLVLATQRPNGVINDDIRANTNLRIALRLHDTADAIDVVGLASPTQLPRQRPGRAVVRLGADEHVTFQAAVCEPPRLMRAILEAAASMGLTAPAPPWLPPLPTHLDASEVPHAALGRIDDPDQQATHPLRWSPADGNVLVVGSAGSGTTTALHALARRALATGQHHVYALTDAEPDVSHDPGVVAVCVHRRELVARLLDRLTYASTRHLTGQPPVVLVIDTIDGVRRALDHPETANELDAFDALLQRSNSNLVIIAAAVRPASVPAAFLARCAHRWVMHLHDPHDATILGTTASAVPAAIPGRLHLVGSGLTAQIALPPTCRAAVHETTIPPPAPMVEVPARVDARDVHADEGLLVGVSLRTGRAHAIELPPGDHFAVLGPARSGRTTSLTRLVTAWIAQHPDGAVSVVSRRVARRSSTDHMLRAHDHGPDNFEHTTGPRLLVVDDAELVDDLDGALNALASTNDGRTSLIIAGRPDALRQMYGHWTAVVRRSRAGLVAAGGSDLDGDLLGSMLPRRTIVPARPGLMWCVANGEHSLVQVALDQPLSAPAEPRPDDQHANDSSRLAPR